MHSDAEELRRCFDVLDLAPNASWDDVRTACRDMLEVWQPDRFTANPRLQKRAEAKTAAINAALERLRRFYQAERGEALEAVPEKKPLPNPIREALVLLFMPLRVLNTAVHAIWRYAFLIIILLVLARFAFFGGMPEVCSMLPSVCNPDRLLRRMGAAAPGMGQNSLYKDVDKVFERVAADM